MKRKKLVKLTLSFRKFQSIISLFSFSINKVFILDFLLMLIVFFFFISGKTLDIYIEFTAAHNVLKSATMRYKIA